MKYFILLGMLIIGLGAGAQHDLEVKVTGLKGKGKLLLGVYNSQEHFLEEEGMIRHVALPVEGKEMNFKIEDLPTGKYAMAFMVDTNGNDEMDYYFFGLPKEKYGFCTDPGIIFSLPKFDDLSFMLDKDDKVEMKAK